MKTPMMNYVRQTLQPGEEVWATGGIHPAYLIGPGLRAIALGVILMWSMRHFEVVEIWPAAPWVLLLPWLGFLHYFIIWATTEAALTNCRVLVKSGWISRKISEIALAKIESTEIEQGVIGRVFGFGDLVVHGSGGHAASACGLTDVMQFRAAVQNAAALGV